MSAGIWPIGRALFALLTLSALCACESESKPAVAERPGATYESLKDLPDWSGSWQTGLPFPGIVPSFMKNPSPLRPALMASMLELRKQFEASGEFAIPPGYYCRPVVFSGFNGGFEGAIEFLFTPGRVTLNWEGGLVRRIYTDGRSLPVDADESPAGTSIGHWEDNTLVVETTGLSSSEPPYGLFGWPPIGKNARITEHLYVDAKDQLHIDTELVAPELLIAPVTTSIVYDRNRQHTMGEFTACVDNDRSLNQATGERRFDLTPPGGLPPPPSE